MEDLNTLNIIIALIPLIVIQCLLAIYCLVKIFKYGVANLNKWGWAIIVLFFNLFGPILFLIIGRRKDI